MDIRFDGQTVIVSGARWGIGRGIVKRFIESGATVFCCDKDSDGLEELARQGAKTAKIDLTDNLATSAWIRSIEEQTGRPVRAVVNNAGGFGSSVPGEFLDVADDAWESTMAINLLTTVRLCKAVVPGMKAAGVGSIVNISSGAGLGASSSNNLAYTAAKHAVIGLTRQMAFGLGKYGITVNAVAPGFVLSTPDTKNFWSSRTDEQQSLHYNGVYLRRVGVVDDIVPATLFLSSDYASWISGEVLPINGGRGA